MSLPRNRVIVITILVLFVAGVILYLKISSSSMRSSTNGSRTSDEKGQISVHDGTSAQQALKPPLTDVTSHNDHKLLLGRITLPVIFQDTAQPSLSEAEFLEIIEDLQMIYGHLDMSGTYDIPPRVIAAGGEEITISKMAYATGSGQHFPEAHMNIFGMLTGDKENYRIVIPKELMTAYRSAFDFRNANVEAFERMDSLLPAGDLASPKTSGVQPVDIIWVRSPSMLTPEIGARILKEASLSRFRRPSILEYFTVSGEDNPVGLPGLPDGTIVGIAKQVENGNIPKQSVVLVYIDGRWKIGIAPFGT